MAHSKLYGMNGSVEFRCLKYQEKEEKERLDYNNFVLN